MATSIPSDRSDSEQLGPTPRVESPSLAWRSGGGIERAPVRGRELIAVVLLVTLGDLTIYRGQGFAGPALLLLLGPPLLSMAAPRGRWSARLALVYLMLLLVCVRLVWSGSALLVVAGFWLTVALAMTLAGRRPFVPQTVLHASQSLFGGAVRLADYFRRVRSTGIVIGVGVWLSVLVPTVAVLLFATLFVMANPDLATWSQDLISRLWSNLLTWFERTAPRPAEFVFWIVFACFSLGLLYPVGKRRQIDEDPDKRLSGESEVSDDSRRGKSLGADLRRGESLWYPACRNMLIGVTGLFAVYLVFEVKTMWFRVFPEGFHYSGYAHQGAAWLTVALALSTVVLSLVFRGGVMLDPRLPGLRRLAWFWSLENFLLAVAVYYRLYVYIGFNGMSRMRIVGIYGMTAVVIGFVVVLWKISRDRSFTWLMQRHLWTLALMVYLYALTPVDWVVVGYNVRRIMAGDPAPSVQISVHPIDSEGVVLLEPLTSCDDAVIREGIRALLAERLDQAEEAAERRARLGWTAFQWSDRRALKRLRDSSDAWSPYQVNPGRREATLERFHRYAYQWY